MIAVEGYTEFDPPQIAVSESVYKLARRFDGRARMTLAHELGHLGNASRRIKNANG